MIVVFPLLFGPMSTVWSRNCTFPDLIPRKFSIFNLAMRKN